MLRVGPRSPRGGWDRAGPPARVRPGGTAGSAQHLPSPGWGGSPNTAPGMAERHPQEHMGCSKDAEPPQQRETLVCPEKRLFQTVRAWGKPLVAV